ncbi:unnamed protein product [Amoebophrya sp. A120]|nr:unnamed protein product [Amoebophrya sp. A120]|eukprot:GSA120T00018091001.1
MSVLILKPNKYTLERKGSKRWKAYCLKVKLKVNQVCQSAKKT